MSSIASAIAGRIRVRAKELRQPQRRAALVAAFSAFEGVLRVEENARAGSVILFYDATAVELELMEAQVELALDKVLAQTPSKAYLLANRYTKRGMMVSLAASLVLAASGTKKAHAATGGVFVACLAVHLWLYRRNLWH